MRVPGVGQADLADVGSRVGAWRRMEHGTLDLVLVGVPRVVTGSLLPTGLAEGSPETTGIPQCWRRVAPRLLACLHPMAEEAEHSATGRTRREESSGRRHGSLTEPGVGGVDERGEG